VRKFQLRLLIADFLIIFGVLTFSAILRSIVEQSYQLSFKNAIDALSAGLILLYSLYSAGCYNMRNIGAGVRQTKRILKGSTNAFLVIGTLSLILKREPSRFVLFAGFLVGLTLLLASRKLIGRQITIGRAEGSILRNTLVIGTAEYAEDLKTLFEKSPDFGLRVVERRYNTSKMQDVQKAQWLADIDELIKNLKIEVLIIQDSHSRDDQGLNSISWHFNKSDVEIMLGMSFLEDLGPRLDFEIHDDLPLIYIDEPSLSPAGRFLKRLVDIVVSLFAILLFLPVMFFVSLGILVKEGRPIIFTQNRVGLRGEIFKFLKFRTMKVGSEEIRADVIGLPDEDVASRYKDDPRIFPLGRLLRRFSLDELPQFFSVLSGNMSLVGPRPLLIEEIDLLKDSENRRHLIKPGLTGLWQISGRKETSWDERIQMDLQYVHNWSLGLDLGIILKTFRAVLSGHGSY